jgi:hypothetical protein
MLEHGETIGKILKTLGDPGLANDTDTIVVYSTDNVLNHATYPRSSGLPGVARNIAPKFGILH